jgi:hypothetical protein
MAKSVIGVIVGYLVMFALQFAAFMTIYTVLGPDWSFEPGSYHASTRWTLVQFTVIFVTALIAGLICAIIAKGGKAPLVLAIVIIVIGFTLGVLHIETQPVDTGEVRGRNVPNIEAMTKARHPAWVIFLGPVIGAVGAVVGGKLKRRA